MSQLHPYWRMEYIEAPRPPASPRPFTDLPASGDDRAALIVHRTPLSYLMLLVIPFREVSDLADLTPAEQADLMAALIFGEKLLRAVLRPDAFNIGFNLGRPAGGSIDHLHGHIVPRWSGDNNFMPVLGQTRILPQALTETWEKLAAEAARMTNAQ